MQEAQNRESEGSRNPFYFDLEKLELDICTLAMQVVPPGGYDSFDVFT